MQQSVNFVSVIPIKKRRFPVIESISPEEKCPVSAEMNEQEPKIVTATTDAPELSKPSAEIAIDRSLENYEYNPMKAESEIRSEPSDDLNNKLGIFPNQASGMGTRAVIVKQEIASESKEGARKLELSAGAPDVELRLEHKKPQPLTHASGLQNSENVRAKSDKSNPLLLSLVMSNGNLDTRGNRDMATNTVDNESSAIRSNWDLNTSMDEWEASTNNDSFSSMREYGKTCDSGSKKSSLSNPDVKTTAAIVGLGLNKKGHILSECGSNSCIASILPNHHHEPYVSLGLSLAVPFRELDMAKKHSVLYHKSDSTVVAPNLKMRNTNLNFPSFSSVKLEPISEVSKSEFSIKSGCSDMGFSNSSSVKQELVKKHNSRIVYPSSISPQILVEHRSIKSELIHECNQESTASSSATTMSVTPQNSCSSKSSTCTELKIGENQYGFSFHNEEVLGRMNKCSNHITGTVSETFSLGGTYNAGSFAIEDSVKLEITQIDGRSSESFGRVETAVKGKRKINLSTKMLEEKAHGSDYESYENQYTPRKVYNKEEREYEEGEVRTPLQHSAREDRDVDAKKINDVKPVRSDLRNFQPFVLSGDQSTSTSDYDGKSVISSENHDETHIGPVKCVISGFEPKTEEKLSHVVSDNSPETKIHESRSFTATIDKLVERQDAEKGKREEVTGDRPVNGNRLVGQATDMINKEVVSARPDSTLSMAEASDGNNHIRDFDYLGNKSRIINLARATVDTSYRTRSIPTSGLSPGNGKERYSDFNGDMQHQWKRNDNYTDNDSSFRNSRPNFMRGRGRGAGRFGRSRNDWDSEHKFASEAYNGPSGCRGPKYKHTSPMVDGDLERRKVMNDNRFMRHLPDDTTNPVYNRPHTVIDEFGGQIMQEKNHFRKGYSQILSKSPVIYENRSPGPWPSHRRKSSNEIEELNQLRSPPPYRMRRMRSFDHEEIISRRRVSPSYVTRHSGDSRDVDSVTEHVHPRLFIPNRRSPPARSFPRPARRDVDIEENSKFIERRGGAPLHSSQPSCNGDSDRFHFRPSNGPRPYRFCPDGDTEFDERNNVRERKFVERNNVREREFDERSDVRERGFDERSDVRERGFDERSSMRERVFEERSNLREREFDGRIKHQPVVASRRIRDIEERTDGNYRHSGQVWHGNGFNEVSELKRRKF